MAQRILGIDLGQWSVKALLIETGFRTQRLIRAEEELVEDGPNSSLNERQSHALQTLLHTYGEELRADATVVSFPGNSTAVRFVSLPFADTRRINQIIEGELADALPFDLSEGIYDKVIVERREQKGTPGESLILAAAAQSDPLMNFLSSLAEAGVDPKFLPVDVLSLYNLYTHCLLSQEEAAEGPVLGDIPEGEGEVDLEVSTSLPEAKVIIDIGHTKTLVLAASKQGIAHVRVLRAGGHDVTKAIMSAYHLDATEASNIKHTQAQIATTRHPAPNDSAQRLSDVVTRGLSNLVRDLRRTLVVMRSERRIEVSQIHLVGGGSKIPHLEAYLTEVLDIPVTPAESIEENFELLVDSDRAPAFAGALAATLRAGGSAPISTIDLRQGEFSFSGGFQHLKNRLPAMLTAVGVIAVMLLFYAGLNSRFTYAREAEINKQFCKITKEVTGTEICEPTIALSVMRQPSSELGSFALPKISAFGHALSIAQLVPVKLKLTELNIDTDRIYVEGEVGSFDAVDKLVEAYSKNTCFKKITKDKLRKKGGGSRDIEFQLKIQLEC